MADPAPFHQDLAEGPEARAFWCRGDDGVRIRVAVWPEGPKGTVILFPGRCEYVEKYGRTAAALGAAGYGAAAVDWRGQGLADRLLKNPDIGHVRRFGDYQTDVRAFLGLAAERGLPRPWFLLAHSMGGAIGLRALTDGRPFASAAFSAPMWGIQITPGLRQLARTLPVLARALGQGGRRAPASGTPDYFEVTPFDENFLTSDRGQWDYMRRQAGAVERFRLGGPSLVWLAEALAETRALARVPLPAVPALAAVGSDERIVDPAAIGAMTGRWQSCTRLEIPGARHELLMEAAPRRRTFLDAARATFERAAA